jgi:hypothetical protein
VQLQGVWLLPDLGSLPGVLGIKTGPSGTQQAIEGSRRLFRKTIAMLPLENLLAWRLG